MTPRLEKLGINLSTTSPCSPESISVAKRMNSTLLNKVRPLLKGASLPQQYWGEALRHARYLYNRTRYAYAEHANRPRSHIPILP